jgi:hypothetical protein
MAERALKLKENKMEFNVEIRYKIEADNMEKAQKRITAYTAYIVAPDNTFTVKIEGDNQYVEWQEGG